MCTATQTTLGNTSQGNALLVQFASLATRSFWDARQSAWRGQLCLFLAFTFLSCSFWSCFQESLHGTGWAVHLHLQPCQPALQISLDSSKQHRAVHCSWCSRHGPPRRVEKMEIMKVSVPVLFLLLLARNLPNQNTQIVYCAPSTSSNILSSSSVSADDSLASPLFFLPLFK